eukprot:gnl/TRDRNA2_/TRDRNA2_129420_c0_seq1.p1 gnl/TRDRNA2_/TRDRNA2_129420_c0~~gnl/TRDRNA2_/TRDRNA2_129420_c0_seq1.p1  ORF type:complete len:417 (-),score=73.29 gnl/TRDRNA2_/TRDRNA2_129420_c0_seq1:131-1381(-)
MSQTSSFLTTLDTIRAFGMEGYFVGEFHKSIADFNRTYYWIHAMDRLVQSLLVVVCIPLLTIVLGLVVVLLGSTGLISTQLATVALALASGIGPRITLMLWTMATTEKFFGGAQRMGEYAELPWEGCAADHAAWDRMRSGDVFASCSSWTEEGTLELVNVHLRYKAELPLVLRGLSLRVEQGQKVGVCGRTGSGKSTLFLACFRMIDPEKGRVIVDGRDVSTVPLPELRARLAIVPQQPLMFSGTVRDNLDFHGQHSDAELWEALSRVCLESQFRKLDAGLAEPVKEKGHNFSAGTGQLLCIARVLLSRRRLIFMDECTASVDYETDAAVQVAVRQAFAGCAVLCIAHRIHTIIDYDRIACLDAGQVAEFDSPHSLLQQAGFFSKLVGSTGAASAADLRLRAAAAAGQKTTTKCSL